MVPNEAMHSDSEHPSLININLLESRVRRLENLCQEVDPFIPLTGKLKDELAIMGIVTWRDPNHLTKQIIIMFEDSVKELNELKEEEKLPSLQ